MGWSVGSVELSVTVFLCMLLCMYVVMYGLFGRYLLDAKWFNQWKAYVGFDDWNTTSVGDQSANPGPVDNSFIVVKGLPTSC